MEIKHLVYLDYAAGTPIDVEVLEKMLPYFGNEYGNPSSVYKIGRKSKSVIQKARAGVSEIIGATHQEIIFTGSGTEANNLAILGIARANKRYGNHVLISSLEHKSVLESAEQLKKEGFDVEYIPVDKYGVVDVDVCMNLVNERTILISVMYANNEIGTVEPIQELGRRLKDFRQQTADNRKYSQNQSVVSDVCCLKSDIYPIFHTDACQVVGQLPIDVNMLGVDMMTLNSGKIYGPKGVGVLYKKENINIEPIIFGGGQENGIRSGTESVPLIVGIYEALTLAEKNRETESVRLTSLRDYFIQRLQETINDIVVNGHPTNRLPNNVHVSIPNIEGESIILMLDEEGIQASTGSACSSQDLEVSHVLKAIKQDEKLMHGSIRFSLGKETTKEDIDYLIRVFEGIVKRLKSMSSLTVQL